MCPSDHGMTRAAGASATVLIMVSYRQPGTVLTERTFTVPLDHAQPGGEQITVFAREVVAAGRESAQQPSQWQRELQSGRLALGHEHVPVVCVQAQDVYVQVLAQPLPKDEVDILN